MVARRSLGVLALLASLAAPRAPAQVQDMTTLRQAIAQAGGRVIITLKSSHGAAIRAPGSPPLTDAELSGIQQRIATDYPVQVVGQVSLVGALVANVSDADVARLAADSSVYAIEPDVKTYLTTAVSHTVPSRPSRQRADVIPWGVTDVGAPAAWAAGLTGAGVKVGIMDTGIDYTHPDLNVVGGYDFTTMSTSPAAYNDTFSSCDGHGTHVAGTVAAKQNGSGVVGVAPGASLYALKVFTDIGTGCFAYLSMQEQALQWAVTNHLDVVSISIGNSFSPSYAAAVASANAAGVVVVAAAGNSGGPGVVYPAAAPGAIAVAALDQGNTVAGYSTSGPEIWVAAPGSNVLSTIPGGGTGTKSGTSMATPHVTGVVALIRQAHPTWSVAQVAAELKADAVDLSPSGFDNSSGWGMVQVPSTGTTPVTLSAAPAARSATVQQGGSAPGDNAAVTLGGTNGASTAWSATKKKSWLTLTTASGTGSGTVAWTRSATGLAAGTYVDTITISTAVTSSVTVFDTLKVTAVPPVLAVSPAARATSVQQGNAAPGDNATVTLTGTNAGTTAWTATKKKSWLTLTTASGTGSGTVAWTRSITGLAVGTYVDTITVSAAGATGSPGTIFDTLKVTAAPIPVTLAASPAARSTSVQQGNAAPGDNATVTLAGTNAATTAWTATKKKSWLTLTTASGTGSGSVAWTRSITGLAVGTYVDTITISTAVTSPVTVFDTLKVTAAPIPVTLAASPGARSASVQQGNAAPGDNATVTLAGTNAATTAWTATKKKSWLTLTTASGTGSGTVAWTRSATGLAVGTYVDTITISTAVTSPVTVFDTLKVTAAPIPVTLAVSPVSRSVSVQIGTTAPGDNATVTLTGTNAGTTPWSATRKKSWLTFTASSGTGTGTLAWTRSANGLAAGVYVDTITVSTAVTTAVVLYDSMTVTAAPIPVALAVTPSSRSVAVQQGNAAPGDNATVTLTGTNAPTTAWSATKKKSWLTFTASSGTGTGTLAWTRNAFGLAPGVYVDTITVSTAVTPSVVLYDTLAVTAIPVPIAVAVSPAGRSATVTQGGTAAGDNANVTLTGTGASTDTWTATHRQGWITLVNPNGTGSGTLSWSRNAAGLAPGTYVDTIVVAAAGTTSAATLVDTLHVNAARIPVTVALSPAGRTAAILQGGSAPGDQATITLSGSDAGGAAWAATATSGWAQLGATSGRGSGTLTWNRNSASLPAGVYVDTITVTVASSGQSAQLVDTLRVTAVAPPPPPPVIALAPHGRRVRELRFAGASSLILPDADSAFVQGSIPDSLAAGGWTATVSSARLTLTTSAGGLATPVRWSRPGQALDPGLYVDTVIVSLQRAPAVIAQFIDSIEVVTVSAPPPDGAVGDLFDHSSLTDDQRQALDRQGNNNGQYDLGDFLAWVNRNHIRLSESVSARLLLVRTKP